MHFQICNSADEFEPRTTPKPAPKFDCSTAPSVPEVSLIFDKPVQQKKLESERSTCAEVKKQSYAEWREQNFSGKGFKPHSTYINLSNLQRDGIVNAQYNFQQHHSCDKEKLDCIANTDNLYHYTPKKKDGPQVHCEKNHNKYIQSSNDYGRNRTGILPVSPKYGKQQPNTLTHNSIMYPQNTCKTPQTKSHAISQRVNAQRLCQNGSISVSETITNNTNLSPNAISNHDGKVQSVASMNLPYPFYDVNSHTFPHHFCSPAYVNHGTESQETVKNLLQLVNSQSEQIRALQIQVDRLLKMQEDTLRQSMKCVCTPRSPQHTEQYSVGTHNSINQPTEYIELQTNRNNQTNATQNPHFIDKTADIVCDKESGNHHESTSVEQQSTKTVVEQKVSIGVMTSFEFTVQNNPFILDANEIDNNDVEQEKGVLNRKNLCNTNDALRRGKNTFSRLPSGILENIVEDSESYLSSSQQQSSNLNASSSTRDLQDKQQHMDYQRHTPQRNVCNANYEEAVSDRFIKQKYPEYHDSWVKEKEYTARNATGVITDTERFMNNALNHTVPNTDNNVASDQVTNNQKNARFTKMNKPENILNPYNSNDANDKHSRNTKRSDCVDESLILSGGDLRVDETPPTPEPSIHVEMQEYSSDDESDKFKKTSKVGWTFYNNVLGQVNQILQNTHDMESEPGNANVNHNVEYNSTEGKAVIDTVKVATLEQLRKLGISLGDHSEIREASGKKVGFDTSYYPRLDYQANIPPSTSVLSETNTSMHMKALALKYLNDEQLADLAIQKHGSASLKHVMLSNMQGTNMSFATMRYLERYQLLPGKGNAQHEAGAGRMCAEISPKLDVNPAYVEHTPGVPRYPFDQTPRISCPSKILDISTLKQQPKLL